jgi:hypothetical protein
MSPFEQPCRFLGGRRRYRLGPLIIAAILVSVVTAPGAAAAGGPPQIGEVWVIGVTSGSATLNGEVNPEGSSTTCDFEYVTDAHFKAEGFTSSALAGCEPDPGSGSAFVTVAKHVSALKSNTTYHYRVTATGEGTTTGPSPTFTTQETGAAFKLPDARGWELVSPVDKNGGAIQGPEASHGGGVLQAAATGVGEITYSSAASFGGHEAAGAPPASQYVSRRSAAGWSTENITTPILSGSYGSEPNGVPYQLFSPDLARGVMLNGEHCRGEGTGCPVANPPLPGSGAPAGYQDYYLVAGEGGGFQALLTEANKGTLALSAEEFNLALAGASPDLGHLVLSTCAALTPAAAEVPGTEGCDPTKPNLYEWSGGGGFSLINVDPGAELAARGGAVSADGSRVYFTEAGGLWLREGSAAPHELAAGGELQTAVPDGQVAFFTTEEAPGELHLFRYKAATHSAESVATGVKGVLGASADGQTVYYQGAGGLQQWREGQVTTVASGPEAAQPSDYPATTGTARVSADADRLLFLSKVPLTGYDNHDATTGQPDSEVFLWSAGGGGSLACVSCNPTGERPAGPSTIPGAYSNGAQAAAAPGQIVTDAYKPRNLSAGADRVFFTSEDALVALDTDKASDAYQWEAQGTGSCAKPAGCIDLISSGTDPEGARFIDASESGEDAYFLTAASLGEPPNLPHMTVTPEGDVDPGSVDVYDARVGGGFPEPANPIPCEGDACQPLPSPPEDPTVGSLIPGAGNPPVHFPKVHKPKKHHKKKHKQKQKHSAKGAKR